MNMNMNKPSLIRMGAITAIAVLTAIQFFSIILDTNATYGKKRLGKNDAAAIKLRSNRPKAKTSSSSTIEIHNSVALRSSNVTKFNTAEYRAGQFCDKCA